MPECAWDNPESEMIKNFFTFWEAKYSPGLYKGDRNGKLWGHQRTR